MTEWIGFAAGALTAFAFFPQVLKTLQTRSAGDLSAAMLSAQSAGVGLWIVYGVAIGSPPVIVANGVTFTFTLILLVLKVTRR